MQLLGLRKLLTPASRVNMPYRNREFDRRRKRALYAHKTKGVPMPSDLVSQERIVYQTVKPRSLPPCSHGSTVGRCFRCRKIRYEKDVRQQHHKILWSIAKSRAKRKGITFSIEPGEVVVPSVCPVLGIQLDRSDRDHTPSLDRKIPELGYVSGNVFVISQRANRIKSDASLDELRAILRYAELS